MSKVFQRCNSFPYNNKNLYTLNENSKQSHKIALKFKLEQASYWTKTISNISPFSQRKKNSLVLFFLHFTPKLTLNSPSENIQSLLPVWKACFLCIKFLGKNCALPLEQQKPGQTGCCWLVIVIAVFPWPFFVVVLLLQVFNRAKTMGNMLKGEKRKKKECELC